MPGKAILTLRAFYKRTLRIDYILVLGELGIPHVISGHPNLHTMDGQEDGIHWTDASVEGNEQVHHNHCYWRQASHYIALSFSSLYHEWLDTDEAMELTRCNPLEHIVDTDAYRHYLYYNRLSDQRHDIISQ